MVMTLEPTWQRILQQSASGLFNLSVKSWCSCMLSKMIGKCDSKSILLSMSTGYISANIQWHHNIVVWKVQDAEISGSSVVLHEKVGFNEHKWRLLMKGTAKDVKTRVKMWKCLQGRLAGLWINTCVICLRWIVKNLKTVLLYDHNYSHDVAFMRQEVLKQPGIQLWPVKRVIRVCRWL